MNERALGYLDKAPLASERVYELVWSWHVEDDPFKYTGQLFKIWMRRRLPIRSLRTRGSIDGTVMVRIELHAHNQGALAEWLSFAPRGVARAGLALPPHLSITIRKIPLPLVAQVSVDG